jgi:hypothetical protein
MKAIKEEAEAELCTVPEGGNAGELHEGQRCSAKV